MLKLNKLTILEDEVLEMDASAEPMFEGEARAIFPAKIRGAILEIPLIYKDQVIDLARDYFAEVLYIGDKKERFKAKWLNEE